MHFQGFLIVPLFGLVASGAAVIPQEPRKLLSAMAVNGNGIDLTKDDSPCGKDQTVLTCAENIAKTWKVPTSTKSEPQRLRIPLDYLQFTGYVEPLVYVDASECALSNANVLSQGQAVFCSRSSCSEQFTFSTTKAESHALTIGSELSITLAAEVDVPLLAKFTTTITGKESQSWTDTDTITVANTTTTTWTLANGEMCQPTVIQYSVQCQAKVIVADEATQWRWINTNNQQLDMDFGCDKAEEILHQPDGDQVKGLLFWQFCQALKSEAKKTTINVGLPGYNSEIWSLQGCMWPTQA